jgi:aspartyl-tRNA(Asn)/glutamyl-tRNA(Gln) amidotransferase subunit C
MASDSATKVDEATVARIARLARLKISPEKQGPAAGQLAGILNWVQQLDAVNTDGVPPMTSVAEMELAMRHDVVIDGDRSHQVLGNASEPANGFFTVPKVVE